MTRPCIDPSGPTKPKTVRAAPAIWEALERNRKALGLSWPLFLRAVAKMTEPETKRKP